MIEPVLGGGANLANREHHRHLPERAGHPGQPRS